jgi:hypothetical protein
LKRNHDNLIELPEEVKAYRNNAEERKVLNRKLLNINQIVQTILIT